MRLTDQERRDIAQAAMTVLPRGTRVSLFGSHVDDAKQWRDVRNRLAHETPDQVALRHSAVLAAVAAAQALADAYTHWKTALVGA